MEILVPMGRSNGLENHLAGFGRCKQCGSYRCLSDDRLSGDGIGFGVSIHLWLLGHSIHGTWNDAHFANSKACS